MSVCNEYGRSVNIVDGRCKVHRRLSFASLLRYHNMFTPIEGRKSKIYSSTGRRTGESIHSPCRGSRKNTFLPQSRFDSHAILIRTSGDAGASSHPESCMVIQTTFRAHCLFMNIDGDWLRIRNF
ncbi:hypothetical protein CHS0354_010917 [Potamilus streckersoni]|uniref:Uncharacterized protein n=1 Tax=Potamilus streckersoni TaxID=2493646 RepID=A0AAE0W1Y6_9BIVA|nr:hypothetical protein CHS0354_010917 [Potamilus streckersoni]